MKKVTIFSLVLSTILISCGQNIEEIKPVRKNIEETVFAAGSIEPENKYFLTALTDGILTDLTVNEGDLVQKGQIIGSIENNQNRSNYNQAETLSAMSAEDLNYNSPVLEQSKNAIQDAKVRYETDSLNYLRFKRLASQNTVSQTEFENVRIQFNNSKTSYFNAILSFEQKRKQLKENLIRANNQKEIFLDLNATNQLKAFENGRVYRLYKRPGDFVRRGETIAVLGDPSRFYAKVFIDENNIHKIKSGQLARIQLNTKESKTYKGRVRSVLPYFEETSQSFICELDFIEPLNFKIIGTQLQTNIIVKLHKNALVIPRRFIDLSGKVNLVGKKTPVKINASVVSNEWVIVESGLQKSSRLFQYLN
jgi:HlyD family secretion protein